MELVGANEPRLHGVVQRLITDMLRRWPTDGVRDDRVEIEALWTDFDRVPSTAEAREERERAMREAKRQTNGRRKRYTLEHVVPCCVLRDWLLDGTKKPEDEVLAHLQLLCLGALISTHQDKRFKIPKPSLTDRMPEGWTVSLTSDPWARYKKTPLEDGRTLFAALDFPPDYPRIPPGARIRS